MYTRNEWEATKKFWNYRCCYCGKKGKGKFLTKEHILPTSKGGLTTRNNIVPACSHCNTLKGNEGLEEWYREQLFFHEDRLMLIYAWQNGMCYSMEVKADILPFEKGKTHKKKKQHYRNQTGGRMLYKKKRAG